MKLKALFAATAIAASSFVVSAPAQAQEKVLAEIFPVAFNWCPRGSARLDGQILPISQNQALFSLLGTTYGGDGRTSFALPDLRGRSPMGEGSGPGLTPRNLGARIGAERTTFTVANMPAHTHSPRMAVSRVNADSRNPINSYFARTATNVFEETTEPTGDLMAADAIQSNLMGAGQPVSNMMPTLVINYCIVTQGLFPSRN